MGSKSIIKLEPGKYRIDARVVKAGREFRKRETFHGSKQQAEERRAQIKSELRLGAAAPRKVYSFGDILELYREKSPPFSVQRNSMFGQIKRDLGGIGMTEFPDRLEAFLKIQRVTPTKKTGKPLLNSSINRQMQMIMAALNLAVKIEVLEKNPLLRARFPKFKEVARDRVLTLEEIQKLFSVLAVECPHLKQIVTFALQVPCRKSELVYMRREDLDMLSDPPSIRVRNGTTKTDEGLWKPVPPDMLDYFRSIPPECPYLFYRLVKGQYRPLGDFKTAWGRCKRLAGITDFHFHDTRHISATDMVDRGTPERAVMQVAGWKTDMLRDYYHRDGKKSLKMVRFSSGTGLGLDTSQPKP